MQPGPFAVLVALALAAALARPAGAQEGPLGALALPHHDGSGLPDLARPQAAAALALDPLCGTTVTGVLVLDHDIACGSIELELARGATLDLGGFTYEGYLLGGRGVTLRNGTVAHGYIDFYGCEDCRIEAVHVRDSDGLDGFVVGLGERNVVRASRFTGNGVAIDIFGGWGGSDATVVDCEFEDNGVAVNVDMTSGNVVASSAFRGNRIGVLHWDEDHFGVNDNTVSDSLFVANTFGILAGVEPCWEEPCQEGISFTRNRFRDNENSGIWVGGTCAQDDPGWLCDPVEMAIEDNRFEANGFGTPATQDGFGPGDDGLSVDLPGEVANGIRVGGNVAAANADLGIEAPGVEDTGGNRARQNGNPLQCVGVACEQLVDVDVWPQRPQARIHPRHGLIPVAILGAPDFDVREVAVQSLAFGPEGARAERFPRSRRRDVNRDGRADLLVVFRARATGIAYGDAEVCLSGSTFAGHAFGGCAAIATRRPPGRAPPFWRGSASPGKKP